MNYILFLSLCSILFSCSHTTKKVEHPKNKLSLTKSAIKEFHVATAEEVAEAQAVEESENDSSSSFVQYRTEDRLSKGLVQRNQIAGTSRINSDNASDVKSYYLFGADHLKLKNYYFDIPVVYNAQVQKWMHYFLNKGRDYFARYSERSGRYSHILGKILADNQLPRDLIFLAMAESGFNNKAKSWAAAVGPWQFMPYTGKAYGLKIDWYIDERQDPIKATFAATRYLSKLYADFGSWEIAAAAYNAGEGKLGRAIKRYKTENFWNLTKQSYLKSETKNYVPKIMALAIIGKNLKAFGFEDIDFHEPLDFEEIDLPPLTDIIKVASILEVEFEELERLNPELLRWFTPPNVDSYKFRLPVGYSDKWEECCARRVEDFAATEFQSHIIESSKGITIAQVGKLYKVQTSVIADLNPDIDTVNRIPQGTAVRIPFRIGQTKLENMYADLYEKPRKAIRMSKKKRRMLELAERRSSTKRKVKAVYKVKEGDTLWSIAKKAGISLDTLILRNYKKVKSRKIQTGDVLIIK